jgi:tetratricopeptide (TPR) repeat protein
VTDSVNTIENLINHGRFLEARSKAHLIADSDDIRAKQLYALSLSKSGAPEAAREYLEPIYKSNPDDVETAGILGSIYKELFKKNQQTTFALLSRDTYLKNFTSTKSYYTGINAASMSAMVMQSGKGKELAREVIALLKPDTTDFWELATLGEAYLLLKDKEKSIEYYLTARSVAGTDWGKVTSVHNQLWLLNHYIPVSKDVFRIFAPPEVVAFAGHMIDAPNRATPRFPALIEQRVKDAIKGAIRTLHASIGYCSLACGADILFAEAMAEEGCEVVLLIPFDKTDFVNTSIRFAGESWMKRYEELIAKFPVTLVAKDSYGGNDDLFSLLGKAVFGSAVLRSQMYHQEPYLLTVLSEFDLKQKEGGTRDTIKSWPYPQRHTNINPNVMFTPAEIKPASGEVPKVTFEKITDRPVLYMACIELSGVLVMERERIEKLVNTIAEDQQVEFKIFEVTETTIILGLETEIALMDVVRSIWVSTAPFKPDKPIQIGLHVAPVQIKKIEADINIKSLKAISQFATIGSICSTMGFASVLALHPRKFQLDYIGVIQLPDQNENSSLYRVKFSP